MDRLLVNLPHVSQPTFIYNNPQIECSRRLGNWFPPNANKPHRINLYENMHGERRSVCMWSGEICSSFHGCICCRVESPGTQWPPTIRCFVSSSSDIETAPGSASLPHRWIDLVWLTAIDNMTNWHPEYLLSHATMYSRKGRQDNRFGGARSFPCLPEM